jgi:hypothetical protein
MFIRSFLDCGIQGILLNSCIQRILRYSLKVVELHNKAARISSNNRKTTEYLPRYGWEVVFLHKS